MTSKVRGWGSCIPQGNTDGWYWEGHQIKEANSEICWALSDSEENWCCSL